MKCAEVDKITLISFFTGDLPEEKARRVEVHAASCIACRREIQELEKERDDFLVRYPAVSAGAVRPRKRYAFFRTQPVLAAAALLCLALGSGYYLSMNTRAYRTKGDLRMELFVRGADGKPAVRETMVFAPEEQIQFTYSCAGERYLILSSIDRNGEISIYYPVSGDSSYQLNRGRDLPLPNSIKLDSYIGKELFLAVFSARPLHTTIVTGAILDAYRETQNLDLLSVEIPGGMVRRFLITKQETER